MPPIHFKARVSQVIRHSAEVVSLLLISEKRLPRFRPGQFIHLTLDPYDPSTHWPESRVFSPANSVADRVTVRLTISRQGRYTSRILAEAREGTEVWAKGPYGEFVVDGSHGCDRVALIAGGTGITPFCAFMESALDAGTLPVRKCFLFYGARVPELLVYRELAERCVQSLPGFQATYFLEDGAHRWDGPAGRIRAGRLDLDAIVGALGPGSTAYYLSGPKAMVDRFRADLTGRFAVPAGRVLIDAWD